MTTTSPTGFGVLTDAAIERSKLRNGIAERIPAEPHNYEVTWDGIRHFAQSYGDDNPLYNDPEYGKGTRWAGMVAPPAFHYTMGECHAPAPDAATKELLRGDPFAGLGSYQAAMEFEWWRPLRLGERQRCLRSQVGVIAKKSAFGGRSAHVTRAFIYTGTDGFPTAIRRGTWVNTERHATRERKKEVLRQDPYTDEQLAEIDAAYAAETPRGARPRYWEDVRVGDDLPVRVKGPLVTTDIVVWHLGWGMQLTPSGAFRIAHAVRAKAPGLYPRNALNVPDTVQRLHWEPERAHELGLPTSYDYGAMRETWFTHLLTDWIGDDGWLWKLSVQHRGFNYIGDTSWLGGKVVDKYEVDGRSAVDLELTCVNQRGGVTSPATATVLLPTRARAVELPDPPASTQDELLAWDIARLANRTSE
ncbi:FAS1-like dehydratase domain-containing protein [Nocardia arizonensis]|uniref:FAS1-like dehydratase domain-containing protein n=1 Tax=Nocardia arizonensis TaxID=1141647 RepID=UPI0006D1862D|nr:MaoC family dehydratase N-terminal domain-containing protein [Nocardia arizonensis]